ncbi:MAG: LysR family transcriptional regulator [Silvanigrellales bacterium]|nr:LysR family transcriptional regulator [Silvanigrellales bacterium]
MSSDLNEIRSFVAAARHGGLSRAAQVTGVAKATLSRHVANLEERLGVLLVQRTSRQFVLTDAGRHFAAECEESLRSLSEAEEVVRSFQHEPTGTLRIAAVPEIGNVVLPSVLARYLALYPRVEVEVDVSQAVVDLVKDAFDVALRIGVDTDASHLQKRLGLLPSVLVGSASFLRNRPTYKTPGDVAKGDLLRFAPHGRVSAVSMVGPDGQKEHLNLESRFCANNLTLLKDLALQGAGVALVPLVLLENELSSGRLLNACSGWVHPGPPLCAVMPRRRHAPARARALLDLLTAKLRQ